MLIFLCSGFIILWEIVGEIDKISFVDSFCGWGAHIFHERRFKEGGKFF